MLFRKTCPDEGSSTVQSSVHWDPSCHRDLFSLLCDSSCPLLSPQWLTAAVTGQCVGRVQGWCRCQWQLDLVKRCRLRWCLCLPDTSPTPGSRFWSTCLTPQGCSASQTPVCSAVGFVNCRLFEKRKKKRIPTRVETGNWSWILCWMSSDSCMENDSLSLLDDQVDTASIRSRGSVHSVGSSDHQQKGIAMPRLDSFGPGEVFNHSHMQQVLVLPAPDDHIMEVNATWCRLYSAELRP